MGRSFIGLLFVGAMLTAITTIAYADDAKDEAINKDRKLIEGTWRIVALEVNGNKAMEEDARKLSVVNGYDGTWSLLSEGKEISKGASIFDPTKKPKIIDFTPTEGGGKGNQYLGIYELGEKTRKLCFAPPGKNRPTEFVSTPGSEIIFVTFERESQNTAKVTGTFVLAKDLESFDGRVVEIHLYKIHPLIADKAADLVEKLEIKDFGHVKGTESEKEFVIGAKARLEKDMKYYLTLFILKDGKRTHMGEVPDKFLCTVLTNGEPNKVTLKVRAVR